MNKRSDYSNLKEDELVSLIVKGDDKAFEYFVEIYSKKIFNIAYRIINNYEDAFDVSQDIFLKIYQKLHTFKGDCSLSTWVYRLSTNACIDELRRRKNIVSFSIDSPLQSEDGDMMLDIPDSKASVEESIEKNDIQRIVGQAVSELPEEHRIIIILREFDGLSYDEISSLLKVPIGTVKSRINRARSLLRDILKSRNYFDSDFVK